MTTTISRIHGREVLDSRGQPTVEVEVWLGDELSGRAIVPSGASTGKAEALELRDGDPNRFDGRGVEKAVAKVNQVIAPELVGRDAADQEGLDQRLIDLDGSEQKTNLGANSILGVSLATAKATAKRLQLPLYAYFSRLAQLLPAKADSPTTPPVRSRLPRLMTNMISGGHHGGWNLDFQDFMAVPIGAPDLRTALVWLARIQSKLGELLRERGQETHLIADEGGYGPRLASNREAAELLVRAIEMARLRPGDQVSLAIDVAASHFYDAPYYELRVGSSARLGSVEVVDLLESFAGDFPILAIEDGLAEEDWPGWRELTRRIGERTLIVGDDLFATNPARLQRGIEAKAATAILIKPNQIGTLSETLQAIVAAKSAGLTTIVSARSGETEDSTISDLAVGTAADYIKIGALRRGERTAKYNRLLRISEEIR